MLYIRIYIRWTLRCKMEEDKQYIIEYKKLTDKELLELNKHICLELQARGYEVNL